MPADEWHQTASAEQTSVILARVKYLIFEMASNLRLFAAVLLPSFLLGCAVATVPKSEPTESLGEAGEELSGEGQVRQQEGKVSVSTLGKAQQAYFLENSRYAESLDDLDVALAPKYYELEIVEVSDQQVIAKATPTQGGLKSYITAVSGISKLVVCASDAPGAEISNPVFQNQSWVCGPNSVSVE